MTRPPRKGTIARELGISAAAFTKYIKRGCPIHSVDAARRWQWVNIDPSRRLAAGRFTPMPVESTPPSRPAGAELALALMDRLAEPVRAGRVGAEHLVHVAALADLAVTDDALRPIVQGVLRAVAEPSLRLELLERLPEAFVRTMAGPIAAAIAQHGVAPAADAQAGDDDALALFEIVAGEWRVTGAT